MAHTQEQALASTLIARSIIGIDEASAVLANLDADELRATLRETLMLLNAFVRSVAEHNLVSERAVLRSMGIEPDRRNP